MFRLTLFFPLVLCMCVFLSGVDGWWWGRRRRTDHHHHHDHKQVNNCNCTLILKLMRDVKELKKKLGRRDLAAILRLDENYPGFDDFLDHLHSKRGGFDVDELEDAVERAASTSSSKGKHSSHCGRSLVDHYRQKDDTYSINA